MSKKLQKSLNPFSNKTVTVVGLGMYKTGSGVASACFLASRAGRLIVTDMKTVDVLKEQIKIVKKSAKSAGINAAKIVWHLGGHALADFTKTDLIIRNPDVPHYSEYLVGARRAGVPIDNDVTLFLKYHGLEETLAVTGTRGKTTTTNLLYSMVVGFDKSAFMAGNVGFSPLLEPSWSDPAKPAVFELSSFMLHEFGEQKISPHIAIITNIFKDHLNKYKGIKDYMADKQNIYLHQKPGDFAIFNKEDKIVSAWGRAEQKRRVALWGKEYANSVIFFSLKDLLKYKSASKYWKIRGKHNLLNLAAAVCAARAYGVPDSVINNVIKFFKGVPYRLELIAEKNGVGWYNDSTATSPEGAMAALNSFAKKKIILISGGNSKGLPLEHFKKIINERVRVLIKVQGNATSGLPSKIASGHVYEVEGALEDKTKNGALLKAIGIAAIEAEKGDAVLFSPGLTWLPSINEFARGDLFKEIVKKVLL